MFNPQSRWDRQLPKDEPQVSEPVEVGVRFSKGKILPVYFIFGNNRFKISGINFTWTERKGRSLFYYFSVTDKQDNYQLCFDPENLSWRLLSI